LKPCFPSKPNEELGLSVHSGLGTTVGCVNDGSGILFGFFSQKDTADSVLKRPNLCTISFKDIIKQATKY